MAKEKIQFRVSSSLKSIVGKDLITNDFVAVFELVKNSIDAGASKIEVLFDLEADNPSIWITDNGKGMSEDDIRKKWLFLGYSAKREGVEDEYKKTYAGNKGVGRFSCDRLGKKLTIQSKTKHCNNVNTLTVDWLDYELNSEKEFSDVDVFYEEVEGWAIDPQLKSPMTGLAIQITELREVESWTRFKLEKLKRGLAKLINPFGGQEQEIEILIHCKREIAEDDHREHSDEHQYPIIVNGPVENHILDVLEQKSASIIVSIEEGALTTELRDRGELIYKISEPIPEDLQLLEDSKFRTVVYYLNRSAKATFTRRMGISSKAFGSLFLFKNGFQVFPVGEEGNDYWGFDHRRAQGHSRFLGNRDMMGRVDVSGGDDKFRESSSRDKGLIDTIASSALSRVVFNIIKRFERYVVGVTWQDKLDKDIEDTERLYLDHNRARIIDLISALSDSKNVKILDYNKDLVSVLGRKSERYEETLAPLRALVAKIDDPTLSRKIDAAEIVVKKAREQQIESEKYAEREAKAREQAEIMARQAQEAEATATEAYEEEKKRNLFLTRGEFLDKDLLESFLHQIDLYASDQKMAIENHYKSLLRSKSETVSKAKTLDLVSSLRQGIDKISTASRYATLANFRLESGKVTSDVPDFIEEYLAKIAPLYNGEIQIQAIRETGDLEMTFSPIEFSMVLDNFISNSRKAKATKIVFSVGVKSKILVLTISDDGKGIDKKIVNPEKNIFEKGFTRTKGSGLGLHFCKEMIERMGGSLELSQNQQQRGFELIVKIAG